MPHTIPSTRTRYRIAALSALLLLAESVTDARTTYLRVRLVDLVRSTSVMVVTPKLLDAAHQRESSIRTTWHVFKVEEMLSKRSDGPFAGTGRQSCPEKPAPGIVTGDGELALAFVDVDGSRLTAAENELSSDTDARPPAIQPEMGRRYLLMATDCGDDTSRFPLGSIMGLFEIDAAGSLVAAGRPPDDFEQASMATIRALIADLSRHDRDVAPSGLVVGRVVDAATNQPVADAEVALSGVDEREVRSSDDGWFVFRDVRAFTYNLAVTGRGRIGVKRRVSIGSGERRTDLSIPIHRQPAIHGVLREENGRPIPMVWLNAAPVAADDAVTPSGTFQQVRTDDRGRFSFEALEPGDYLVQAPIASLQGVEPDERPGVTFYPPTFHATGSGLMTGDVVSIRADDSSKQADIVVRPIPMRRVTGVVRRVGVPAADVSIEVRRAGVLDPASLTVRVGRTRPDGSFRLGDLAPGEYLVEVRDLEGPVLPARVDVTHDDVTGLTFDTRAMTVVRSPAGSTATAGGTASIEGVVSDADATHFAGLARTRVTATNVATRAVRRVQTDPNGSFHIGRLSAGRYELLAERDGFLPVTPGSPVHVPPIVTVSDVGATSATLMMRPAGVVTGVVYDQGGAPAAGYHVTLRQLSVTTGPPVMHDLLREYRNLGGVQSSGVTDSEGRYRIFGVPSGQYVVAAILERNVPTSHRTTREEVEQALADVRTKPPSASDSRERLPVYHPSTLDPLSAAAVRVEPGVELVGVDVVLIDAAPVPVSGVVRFDGADVADAIVLQVERVDVRGGIAPFAFADGDRMFTVRSLAPGRYVISARTRTSSDRTPMAGRTVVDVPAAVENVVVTLRPAGSISGRLLVPPGTVSESRPVTLRLEPVGEVVTDPGPSVQAGSDGTFTLPGITPGRYRIRVESGTSERLPWTVQRIGVGGVQLADGVLDVTAGARVTDLVVQLGT